MGRMKFLQWAAAQGWKHGQRYLQKAYNHFYDKGKLPDPKAILQKAKNYYDDFTGFTPTVVKPKPIKVPEQTKNILGIKSTLKGRPVEAVTPKTGIANIGDRIIKQMQKEGTTVKFDDLLRIYGKKPHVSAGKKLYLKKTGLDQGKVIDLIKKPPGKAEGGRIGTGLNYLLGEDDQNSRVPLKKGKTPFKPPSPGENILESTWKNMGPWEKFMWGLSLGGFEKGGRVGLAAGMTPSESWMRDYFYSGKGGHDDSGMTFEFF